LMLKNNKPLKIFLMGPVLMIFSSASFALMSLFAKLATMEIPSTEVTFFRLLMGVIVALILVLTRGVKLVTPNLKLLVVRGFFGGISVLLFFLAIEKGTVTNSVVLQNTYPIFAAFISIYILKEKLTLRLIVFMTITFIGIIMLSRPDIGHIRLGDVFALISGIVGGFAITAVRQLRKKNESVWTIFFYFCFFGAVLSLILSISNWKWPDSRQYILIILTGILGLLGQVTMTAAYKYCKTAIGGILSMSTCVFSFIVAVIFLGEKIIFLDLTGIILIIAGNILVVAFEGEKTKQNIEIANENI
jgi:drug/metabolite transporter (DMT)-like permease